MAANPAIAASIYSLVCESAVDFGNVFYAGKSAVFSNSTRIKSFFPAMKLIPAG